MMSRDLGCGSCLRGSVQLLGLEGEVAELDREKRRLVEEVDRRISRKYLVFFRKLLRDFDLHNHTVEVKSSMGSSMLKVGGKWVSDYTCRSPIIDLLLEIEEILTGEAWAVYLDGVTLNNP